MSDDRAKRKSRTGRVVSNRMDRTVVVNVQDTMRHALYSKAVRRMTRFYAHDEKNECRIGDLVAIAETRPLSKLKRWRVTQILERAPE